MLVGVFLIEEMTLDFHLMLGEKRAKGANFTLQILRFQAG